MNKLSLSMFEAVLFDLDGTVYYGSKMIDGANGTIQFFREKAKRIFFVTNNSTKTRKQVYEKLKRMGIDVYLDEVLTSGYIAATYALNSGMKDIYIFGSPNLAHEFHEAGVPVNQTEDAENLLIGYNPDITYLELAKAARIALKAKKVIACNRERMYPGEDAKLMPGCGAMTAPIEWCANRKCDIVLGKPNTFMVEFLVEHVEIPAARMLVIGDTYESDIEMAKHAGCHSILLDKDLNKKDDTIVVGNIKEVKNYFTCEEKNVQKQCRNEDKND